MQLQLVPGISWQLPAAWAVLARLVGEEAVKSFLRALVAGKADGTYSLQDIYQGIQDAAGHPAAAAHAK